MTEIYLGPASSDRGQPIRLDLIGPSKFRVMIRFLCVGSEATSMNSACLGFFLSSIHLFAIVKSQL